MYKQSSRSFMIQKPWATLLREALRSLQFCYLSDRSSSWLISYSGQYLQTTGFHSSFVHTAYFIFVNSYLKGNKQAGAEGHTDMDSEKALNCAAQDESRTSLSLCIEQNNGNVPVVGARIKRGGWTAACFILATETMERLAFYSISANLVTYLLNEVNEPLPKAINMVSNWIGAAYVLGIPGGFLADAYLGRFCTIVVFSATYIMGLVFAFLSATVPSLRSSCEDGTITHCFSAGPSRSQEAVLLAGMYLIAVGTGGIKPCVSSFGADQFEEEMNIKAKKKMSSFFNWFFFAVNIGAMFAFTVVVYVQDNVGWGAGLAIPLAGMAASLLLLLSGVPLYVHQAPRGSPLTRIAQVLVAASRHSRLLSLPAPSSPPAHCTTLDAAANSSDSRCDHHLQSALPSADASSRNCFFIHISRFLDKAAIPTDVEKEKDNPWRLCTPAQVDECKTFLKVLPIIATTLFLWTGYTQVITFFVKQGSTLNRNMGSHHFRIPPASLPIFSVLNALLVLPFYDRVVVPLAHHLLGRSFSSLQRMGFGLFVSILSMAVAALVERHRLHVVQEHGLEDQPSAVVPLTIFWLAPQYFLVGLAEIFTYVGQLEFFYAEVSEGIRSFSTSLFIAELGVGSWISSLLVAIVRHATGDAQGWIVDNINRSRIDNFYWLLAILSFINFLLFLICASLYRYKHSN
ncbi:hypothetical protein KP509_32G041200 [Ceratopteris richardii]|uniref:Uncharacterized protein n=1 Tax=Ceratopteris richardii TaxID=49495 RepID=A0A8T2QSQ7_CERRI|nr:hypothetical protein KP509_32G041200 [Ceratopteris richardii]